MERCMGKSWHHVIARFLVCLWLGLLGVAGGLKQIRKNHTHFRIWHSLSCSRVLRLWALGALLEEHGKPRQDL